MTESNALTETANSALQEWAKAGKPDHMETRSSWNGLPLATRVEMVEEENDQGQMISMCSVAVFWVHREAGGPNTDQVDYRNPALTMSLKESEPPV